MLIEAKKSKNVEQDQRLTRIQQKVLNIMGSLSKLWVGVVKVKSLGKLGQLSIKDLAKAVQQIVLLVGLASQAATYQQQRNALTFYCIIQEKVPPC